MQTDKTIKDSEAKPPVRQVILLFRQHRESIVAILSGNEVHTGEIIRAFAPNMPVELRDTADNYFRRLWNHIDRHRQLTAG